MYIPERNRSRHQNITQDRSPRKSNNARSIYPNKPVLLGARLRVKNKTRRRRTRARTAVWIKHAQMRIHVIRHLLVGQEARVFLAVLRRRQHRPQAALGKAVVPRKLLAQLLAVAGRLGRGRRGRAEAGRSGSCLGGVAEAAAPVFGAVTRVWDRGRRRSLGGGVRFLLVRWAARSGAWQLGGPGRRTWRDTVDGGAG